MMARILCTVLVTAAVLGIRFPAYAQLDTSVTNSLGKKLDQYMALLEMEPVRVKCEEADFLIESCSDSLVRQFTAIRLYSHFMDSKLMGDEAVSIHIFDKWFAPGTVKMQSELEFMNARIFAEFNRQSLIGMKAPELTLEDMDGNWHSLFEDGIFSDRLSVLFFYDSGCPTCKMESIMLRNILGDRKYRLNFYAVYTGHSREGWEEFVSSYLGMDNPDIRILHLNDPQGESGFQMKYGVLQTPGIFLISRDGIIIGRGLDSMALKQLLDIRTSGQEGYGSEESAAFYEKMFSDFGEKPDCGQVREVCDRIAVRTLEAGDTAVFRQMAGDLMYWLGTVRGEGYKCGLVYLLMKYIEGKPSVWTDPDDSLAILPYAGILSDLLGKSGIGERLPDIKVRGIMKRAGKERHVSRKLSSLRNTAVIFHTEGCGFCREELAAADSLSEADRKARFFLVDTDMLLDTDPETVYRLFDALDLTVMPYITATDRKGLVIRKYMSLR